MSITVEFFGPARLLAGRPALELEAASLGELVGQLQERLPDLNGRMTESGALRPEFIANVNGREFVRDPATPLRPGDRVLIISTDAGG